MASIAMSEENKKKNNEETSAQLSAIFRTHWGQVFITDCASGIVLTYGEFFRKAVSFRDRLQALGVSKQGIVIFFMKNSLDLAMLYFAALIDGIRVVPVDPLKGSDEMRDILSSVDYKLVLVDGPPTSQGFEKSLSLKEFQRNVSAAQISIDEAATLLKGVSYDAPFLISFTSGSTGKPKGVMHSSANLLQSATSFSKAFGFNHENIFYHNLPMTYMAGILNQIFLPMVSGSSLVLGERFSVASMRSFWDMPIKHNVNTFWLVPTILSLLMKVDRGTAGIEYAKTRKVISCVGTAPLDMTLRKAFEARYGISLYESYGLSETLFNATESPLYPRIEGSVGKPLQGVTLDYGADGEILVNTGWMFLGYAGGEDRAVSAKGFFSSGDLGYADAARQLFITGRKKDLIIRGGVNISPKRIEDVINASGLCEACSVIGFRDEIVGEKVVCFFVLNSNEKKEVIKIINQMIHDKLGGGYGIDQFFPLLEFPRLTNGKLDKVTLKALYQNA